jgi:tetratricopeptide (TPR) repeat protein
MGKSPYHSLIYSYLKRYQDDPSSRVFAPLAEAYRKAGLIDEAVAVAREGIVLHPKFMGGRVALARALFDKKLFQEVVDELSPIVHDIPDNLVVQRLLAESYLMLGQVAESLSAYKMLLYFAPQDSDIAQIVQELEAQGYEEGAVVLRTDTDSAEDFSISSVGSAIAADPKAKLAGKIKKIEFLQMLLQKVERYRVSGVFRHS